MIEPELCIYNIFIFYIKYRKLELNKVWSATICQRTFQIGSDSETDKWCGGVVVMKINISQNRKDVKN